MHASPSEQRSAEVLILGAGVVGLSCALELLERGRAVTVVDRGRAGGGSSHGNCGTITPSHAPPLAGPGMIGKALRWMLQPDAPLYIRPRWDPALAAWLLRFAARCNRRDWLASARAKGALLSASRRALEVWVARHRLDCEFATPGLLYVFRSPALFDDHVAGVTDLATLGIATEVWDGARLAAEEPALRVGMAGALYFPGDACLRPDRLVASLLARVRERGGVVHEQAAVARIDATAARPRVQLGDGRQLVADRLVVAAGAWSPQFADDLGLRLPIQPGKGYSITYTRPAIAPRSAAVVAFEDWMWALSSLGRPCGMSYRTTTTFPRTSRPA
jgi:D-amino-acid dehydrogenase